MDDLESNPNSEEQASVTEPVSKEDEKTSVEEEAPKTLTEEDIAKLRDEWMQSPEFQKAVQSEKDKSIAKEMQPLKDKIRDMERAGSEAQLKAEENKILETYGDTPEAKDLATHQRKLWERDLDLTEREAKHAELLQRAAETNQNNIIRDIVAEHKDEGVTAELLLKVDVSSATDSAQAKEVLERAAKAIAYETVKANLGKKPPQKIDSSASGGGTPLPDTAMGKYQAGFREIHK